MSMGAMTHRRSEPVSLAGLTPYTARLGRSGRCWPATAYEPVLPTMRHVGVRLLMRVADGIELSAGWMASHAWLTPLVVAGLACLGLSAAR
jgi:hypothetical protein